jgi:hypothetical protein
VDDDDNNNNNNNTMYLNVAVNDQQYYVYTYLVTYLLTPWSTVFKKLTGPYVVKKFPTFYGT